jgi:uncharacterized ferritin-like protein (DUF455 family)
MASDVRAKLSAVAALRDDWIKGILSLKLDAPPAHAVAVAGVPERPALVAPRQLQRRRVGTREGHAALIHALAHIEFNAINLALDCAWRYRQLPDRYYGEWISVAAEEAYHFGLLSAHLNDLGFSYGDFPAHNGLWEMAQKTAPDPLERMALVPRLMEARGLDATPVIMEKLRGIGDDHGLSILEIVLRDEIGHVSLGDAWFRYFCAERGLDVETTYRQLLEKHNAPRPVAPLNRAARRAAGFSDAEIDALENSAERCR